MHLNKNITHKPKWYVKETLLPIKKINKITEIKTCSSETIGDSVNFSPHSATEPKGVRGDHRPFRDTFTKYLVDLENVHLLHLANLLTSFFLIAQLIDLLTIATGLGIA